MKVARSGRSVGAIVGLAVGGALAPVPFGADGSGLSGATALAVGTVAAGAVGGWIFGPSALQPKDARGWVLIVAGLSLSAVVVGAFVVALPLAITTVPAGLDPIESLGKLAGAWLALGALGILVLGLPSLALTIVPAGLWAAAMAWIGGRRRRWHEAPGS